MSEREAIARIIDPMAWMLPVVPADESKRRRALAKADAILSRQSSPLAGGVEDAQTIEILRRALAWHGDPQRMATTREEWQQTIDEAILWVKQNPEPDRPSFSSLASLKPAIEGGAEEATAEQIDAGARYLRETQQAGKRLTPWISTPKATKRKWLDLSEGVLRAALSPDLPVLTPKQVDGSEYK